MGLRPESTAVTARADIAVQLQEYDTTAAAARFIGRRAAPIFESPVCDGRYPIMNRENFKKRTDNARSADGRYNRIPGQVGEGTFTCEDYGLEGVIDDRKRKRYASLFDAEVAVSRQLYFQTLLNHEYRAALLFSGGGFTNHNVATAWTTVAPAVPLTDIQPGLDAIQDKCGAAPEQCSVIIPRVDFREMLATTQVINKTLYTYPGIQPANLQAAQIAAMLGVKQILVASGVVDSTEEGVAETVAQIWTAAILYICVCADENDSLEEPSAARTILWTEDSPELPVTESYRDDPIRSDIIRVRQDSDEVLIGETDLFCYKLTNT